MDLIEQLKKDESMTFQAAPNKFLNLQYADFLRMHTGSFNTKPKAG